HVVTETRHTVTGPSFPLKDGVVTVTHHTYTGPNGEVSLWHGPTGEVTHHTWHGPTGDMTDHSWTGHSEDSGRIDCHTGMKNWQSWSNEHMLFCCKHYGLACPFDCFTGTPELWPPGQRQWCCENSRVGCGAHGQRYDCDAGFSRWQSTWTPSKKQWCCANFNRGCQETGAQGCDALCRTHVGDMSCLERVRSLAESTACREAFERVQEDCPSCGTCTLQSACEEHRWADEQLQAPEEWS
ncbi:unnamed protein product, partial [Effrenium voratum]